MQITAARTTVSPPGIIWLKLAIVYLVIGVVMGIAMGASENFTLRPVHAHINLLGWTTMALAGLTYSVFPEAGRSLLAHIHFWLANISLPIMVIALTLLLAGNRQIVPVLAVSEIVAALGIIVFAANIFLNLKRS
ncbi:MAG: cytochrome-c oxidase [Bacillota bacterium]